MKPSDALQLARTGGFSAQDRGSIRFDRINLNVRILRFEILANSGNGTACAHPSHENINFSLPYPSKFSGPVVLKCVSGLTGLQTVRE